MKHGYEHEHEHEHEHTTSTHAHAHVHTLHEYRDTEVIEMEKDILKENEKLAEENKAMLKEAGVVAYDILGSIGSGKTEIIERLAEILKDEGIRCAAIAGDIAGDYDYLRYKKHGIPAVNINTEKQCHLDAYFIRKALKELDFSEIDVLFIENIGNLVCPMDFSLGAEKRAVVISVTEGDDIVKKHPLMFSMIDIAVLNKVDLAEQVEVDPVLVVKDFKEISNHGKIFLTDAKHGVGIRELREELVAGSW